MQAKDSNSKFRDIYDAYKEKLFYFCLSKLKNNEDAFDVLQEVFLKVYRNLNKIDDNKNIGAYIFKIAQNTIIDVVNTNKKIQTENLEDINENEIADNNLNVEQIVNDKFRNIAVLESLNVLTAREREIFELKYFFDFKIKEIAEKLNISDGAVKRYLFDATRKMKNLNS